MSVIAFYAGWSLLALTLTGVALCGFVRRGHWEEAEQVKYALFRRLAAEAADPAPSAGGPAPAALAALAAGLALYAAGFLVGVSLSLLR